MLSEKVFCGLDIGSHRIKTALLKVKDGRVDMLDVRLDKTYGFKNGVVTDFGEFTDTIQQAVHALLKAYPDKIKDLHIGVSNQCLDVRYADSAIPIMDKGNKIITQRDIERVTRQAKLLGTKMEEDVLHHIPQEYCVDDSNPASNPVGLYGRKLSVQLLMVLAKANILKNIARAVNQAGFDVGGFYFNTLIASDMILTREEKIQGAILVDIGAKNTSILIFKDGILKFVKRFEIGGDDFTHCIAERISLPYDLAEEIKRSYAVALESERDNQEEILVKRESAYLPIKREDIYKAIEPAIYLLISHISAEVKSSVYVDQVNGEIKMMGSGSLLPGLMERIAQGTNFKVKLGTVHVPFPKPVFNPAMTASAVGLAYQAYQQHYQPVSQNGQGPTWLQHFTRRAQELYHEYF